MATTEERFASLESFRTETLMAYKDMAFKMTMQQGLIEDAVGRLAAFRNEMNEFRAEQAAFNARMDMRLDNIVASLAIIVQKLDERK